MQSFIKIKWSNVTANVLMWAFVLLLLQSCNSEKYNFATSTVVPAAEGSVEVEKDGNDNYEVNLKITRLAEPSRLTPPRKLYLVWVQTEKDGVKNIGQLKTDSGFLSDELKSSLKTLTPFKPIGFLISAEDDLNAAQPVGQIVMQTEK
ncbi:hypothetical protein BWI97_22845 [Siphonobacter sp. BAB-5405]|uniref:hypothetical protein n=1 Tax=Siphonobacter sp. BAB-5405 TaxID=1864825 RepID=UPI000C7FE82C|nr:hypothetical protein [Siphonobacter sp. BAB-5405]PMD90334.1 hypothetical protein BWI97_22845 [Siphonobacter sp. BAB-5405]